MNDNPSFSGASESPVQQGSLFSDLPVPALTERQPAGNSKPRLRRANRAQLLLLPVNLEDLLPEDHRARIVWDYVQGLDLTLLYQKIHAVEDGRGRAAIDPKILVALWLYATIEGEGSARALEALCEQHDAYKWICGGVHVNHHTLSDFRTDHVEFLNDLFTRSVATLMAQDLVDLNRVAQDGMRVRASAGAASFRRRKTLEECLREAEEQVRTLQVELDADPALAERRKQAARQRAARERAERGGQALAQLPALEAKKKADDKEKARVSTTDPEARVMKMADGGYRPAYNIQLAADSAHQVIVGVDATNVGSDKAQAPSMVAQVNDRLHTLPGQWLMDGGFAGHAAIEAGAAAGPQVLAPVPQPKDKERDRYAPRPTDSAVIAAWRAR